MEETLTLVLRTLAVGAAAVLVAATVHAASIVPPENLGELARSSEAVVLAIASTSQTVRRGNRCEGGQRLTMHTGPDGPDREEHMRYGNATVLGIALILLAAPAVRSEVLVAAAAVPGTVAVAAVQPLGASTVKGLVLFTPLNHGVEISADVTGLTPGKHGFHIHEFGDCSATDGNSAGPHFNPEGMPHGAPGSAASHAGDYGNLEADAAGHATLKFVSHRITLDQSSTGILGRSVIVHEKADDLATQPTGAAGGRIGCGVIVVEGANTTPITKK